MCMNANKEESCKLNATVSALAARVDAIEKRLNSVEDATRGGFVSVNANIETLSQQITNMDHRIIEEKQKWGEVTRSMAKWTLRAILAIVVYAAGINVTRQFMQEFFK